MIIFAIRSMIAVRSVKTPRSSHISYVAHRATATDVLILDAGYGIDHFVVKQADPPSKRIFHEPFG